MLELAKSKKVISGWDISADLYSMKQMLQFGPLVAQIQGGSKEFLFYSDGVIEKISSSKINHVVIIVGYTHSYFLIKNSFGWEWGQNGYAKLSQDACGILNYVALPILRNQKLE